MGNEGGDKGGEIVFEGTPEDIVKYKKSYTGIYLNEEKDSSVFYKLSPINFIFTKNS